MSTLRMQLHDKNYSSHSKEHTENNISLTSITLLMLGASQSTGENTCAVTCLRGTCIFVGVASVSFRHFVSFLDLLAPLTIYIPCVCEAYSAHVYTPSKTVLQCRLHLE